MTPEQLRAYAETYAVHHLKWMGQTIDSTVVAVDKIATHMEGYPPFVRALHQAYSDGWADANLKDMGVPPVLSAGSDSINSRGSADSNEIRWLQPNRKTWGEW